MRKTVIFIFIVAVTLLFAFYAYKHRSFVNKFFDKGNDNVLEINSAEPVLAVFSFQPGFENHQITNFRHFNLKLFDTKHWRIEKNKLEQITDSIPVLITIETWGSNNIFSNFHNPLEELMDGNYDEIVELICKEWIGTRQNVFLRLNPDMEVPVFRYPWQYYGPRYIDAFRHFAELCRKFAPQVKLVWGPAGYPGTLELYPGDDVVDAATVTIKSDSENLLDVYPKNYSVDYEVKRRLHRLRFIDKPIYVLGSSNINNDSINLKLVSDITNLIITEREVVYSPKNFVRHRSSIPAGSKNNFEIGFYDPNKLLVDEKPVTVEHLFADFGNLNDGTFQSNFNDVIKRGHKVIVTFEPFRIPESGDDLQVLQHIPNGRYNQEINQLFSILTSTNQHVFLRYAHEMEIPITRYPWQSQDPVVYIHSFRYVMTYKNPWPENIKRIWGPAGDRGSIEWYPGNDVVDFLSIAIYGLPDKNITDPKKQESFSTIFNRKYWRLRFIEKPLFITEFGVKGPEEYQTKWLVNAAKVIRNNQQIVGVNYFNMSDTPKAWGDIKPPDWSITRESFYKFLEVLNKSNN